ncbi:MAG TPA: POTRA domain-containing protein [Acidobacteriaceae bacterium]|jgi:outer membrane protein assembly factor BamA|nr:POTRA domain-containing protein [Acidobacteriaceae bacterium]
MNPAPQAPAASSPSPNPQKKEKQNESSIPPGSVLPSYNAVQSEGPHTAGPVPTSQSLRGWAGLEVLEIRYAGVTRDNLDPLPDRLEQQPNTPLDPVKVRDSLRRLFATGLYQTIAVDGQRQGDGVILTYSGKPTVFLGRVLVRGVKNNQLTNQLNYSTRLTPGTPFTQQKIDHATDLLLQAMQENGYYQGSVVHHTKMDPAHAQEDVQFNVTTGAPARVGDVAVQGDSGLALPDFRKRAKLKAGSKVNRDTVSRALADIRKHYQKEQRLEPNVRLTSKHYQAPVNHLNFNFQDDRGPVVKVVVEGAKLSKGKIKSLVPIYAEGALDEDLINSGSKRIRDYLQRAGYFDAKVTYLTDRQTGLTRVTYDVHPGPRDRIQSVAVSGNRYFGNWTLMQRLGVQPSSLFVPHGMYSLALQQADANTITALYQNNGFTNVKVTPEVRDRGINPKNHERILAVTYRIEEGVQQKVGLYQIEGVTAAQQKDLQNTLRLESGQPYSGNNLAADRDAIVSYFLDHGYDQAKVTVRQAPSAHDPNLIDVHVAVTPGDQIFIRNVLISGLHYTRPGTVKHQILVAPGQPLDQSKLLDTQRQLYNLTLFNQVNTDVQNPGGDELRKNVLLQFDEARRWDVIYGVGLQAQTGTPSTNCPNAVSLIQLGINPATYSCSPNGHIGASALVQLDVSRINLFGRNQTITFRSEYGTLEQQITAQYTTPRFLNHRTLDFSSDVGYINAQNVITFASSTEEGDIRVTHHPDLINTLIYQLSYRRVKVDPNTIQVAPNLIPLLSEPVRVGGPELTWIRDTRRPEPLDAQSGMYNSIQEFASDNAFLTSQANFNHFDWTNSTYYTLGRHKNFVLARNTRFGQERVFGEARFESIPLPERLYAGGPESLRGFPLNAAGPRDSLTGFPIGGAGVFVNQAELRLPNPQLPYFGKSLGFVLFHDMGNVFNNSSDIWPAALRIKQPHSYTCTAPQYLNVKAQEAVSRSSSTNPTGTCDFNDFSHSVGIGARYHTPIGPIRFDTSYNLNPPVYPVLITYGTPGTENVTCYPNQPTECYSRSGHFNFFFSIGQAF